MSETVDLKIALFNLYHAVAKKQFMQLDTQLFSRKLIDYLYRNGAFNNEKYNKDNTRDFMLKMFNKRDKESIAPEQHKRINAIILNQIKPFVKHELSGKFTKKPQ